MVFQSKLAFILCFISVSLRSQDIVPIAPITAPIHLNNAGKITFMGAIIPLDQYRESDFLKEITLDDSVDFNLRIFLRNSLTNELHKLAPTLSPSELNKVGNFHFDFWVDDALIYQENLHFGAFGEENKHKVTVFRIPFLSTKNEDSWGRFLWKRFIANGGNMALSEGKHALKIILRPYVNTGEIKVGEVLAEGQINLLIPANETPFDPRLIQIQPIKKHGFFKISTETIDRNRIEGLNKAIAQEKFKSITSIVVLKNNQILLEEYFNGANRNTLHDTRSVGKSWVSALVGMAIQDGYLKSENQPLKDFYELQSYAHYSAEKEKVTIKDLLTMASAFDGSDRDENSPGHEEKMYPTNDWVKFTLDLKIDSTKIKNRRWDYFTAGVVLLGDIVNKTVPNGLEKYAHEKLFKPLGIQTYTWLCTPQKTVNTAGGLRMSALDFAKFGQLYQNKGQWRGRQLLPEKWVEDTFTKHQPITERANEFYGYLFWNRTYKVQGKNYEAFYCAGNGGNKIFVFKDIPVTVVITATAYNTPYAHSQVDGMMETYILPAILSSN